MLAVKFLGQLALPGRHMALLLLAAILSLASGGRFVFEDNVSPGSSASPEVEK